MADLGVKKGISNKKHRNMSITSIQFLPNELLVEILAKVASRSMLDLCKIKLSCKEFYHAAEENYVYQHTAMDKFALVPLPWFTTEKETSFLNRCRETGNLEIQYREAMLQYFSSSMEIQGFENLQKVALEGHDDAKYVYCMLLMCRDDEQERETGFDLFRSLKAATCLKKCRKRVQSFIGSMWLNNPVMQNKVESLCRCSTCHSSALLKKLSRRKWFREDDEAAGVAIECEYCAADYELSLFYNMFLKF